MKASYVLAIAGYFVLSRVPLLHAGENTIGEILTENGDVNGDGIRNISDASYLLNWLFLGGPAPVPLEGVDGLTLRIGELEDELAALQLTLAAEVEARRGCENDLAAAQTELATTRTELENARTENSALGLRLSEALYIPPEYVFHGANAQGYAEFLHEPTGMVFVHLSGGFFHRGSPPEECERDPGEGPVNRVGVSPFLIAKHEVSQEIWQGVTGGNPSTFAGPDLPVDGVSWNEATDFCSRLGLQLPSEAQWEYACRAGSVDAFWFGSLLSSQEANFQASDGAYCKGTPGDFRGMTLSVGALSPNGYGLHHTHGNVSEWCLDTYSANFYERPESAGPDPVARDGSATTRVLRGGAWDLAASECRSASRLGAEPASASSSYGLRPIRPLPPRVEGFTFTGFNPQGLPEYTHEATGLLFVRLPGGSFRMGSDAVERPNDEKPAHQVTLRPFLIAKHEVSQAEWQRVVGTSPSLFVGDELPVERISWDEVQEFEALTGLKIPTEAQWEYACRAGSAGDYGGTGDLDTMGWYNANAGNTTHAVGEKAPNGFGLYDMHGNVSEWCEDIYDSEFYASTQANGLCPLSTSGSELRVVRGGSWLNVTGACRSASRLALSPDRKGSNVGMRPVFPCP